MKHILLIGGVALLGYALYRNHQGSMTVANAPDGSPFNGGVANTSSGNAATNIGAGIAPAGTMSTIPTPVTRSSPDSFAFWGGGGAAAHPIDF